MPLWSERGLIGLFLLGPKRGNGLYTQEDIEIARASGERLIDTRASAEIASFGRAATEVALWADAYESSGEPQPGGHLPDGDHPA